ncbi:MAG: hypothetical protein J5626_10030 [Lachnospiraceae bacterium]|nr:hypothetical protein [Lachnospiraceae bacterium]
MKVINTMGEAFSSFDDGGFSLERWKKYIDKEVPGARKLCMADMEECIAAGYKWEEAFLPVLNAVTKKVAEREEAIKSFYAVTDGLDEKIRRRFGRTVDVDIILYLGLCNGAGWVTPVNGKTTVLLGIEKILELNWCGIDDMTGLIVHELGHVYQDEYGVLSREGLSGADRYLWQLFTEGIAMVFEQEVVGDAQYFHQYDHEWKDWCDEHYEHIKASFDRDLETMTEETQRYFGDWVKFEGHGDTGYYLGTRFVRFLLGDDSFDNLISYDVKMVKEGYLSLTK